VRSLALSGEIITFFGESQSFFGDIGAVSCQKADSSGVVLLMQGNC